MEGPCDDGRLIFFWCSRAEGEEHCAGSEDEVDEGEGGGVFRSILGGAAGNVVEWLLMAGVRRVFNEECVAGACGLGG